MKKVWLPFIFAALSASIYAPAHAEQSLAIALGQLDYSWQEFDENDDFFNPTYVEVVNENGNLGALQVAYIFDNFSAQISHASGSVDYYGRIILGGLTDRWDYSTTDYTIDSIEFSQGKYFTIFKIKPFVAIKGGYTEQERTIYGNPNFAVGNNPAPYPTSVESMHFYYWGLLLDTEVFAWNDFALNIGAEYNRGLKTKQTVASVDETAYTLQLNPLVSRKLLTSLHYSFLNSWKASLLLEMTKSKIKKSREEKPYQPNSEQDHSYLGLRLQKTF